MEIDEILFVISVRNNKNQFCDVKEIEYILETDINFLTTLIFIKNMRISCYNRIMVPELSIILRVKLGS